MNDTLLKSRQSLGWMDLPVEVRHSIYEYLFCHKGSPVWLGTRYRGLPGAEPSEPTFYTQLFLVSKPICLDAVQFAYSSNTFILRDSFPAFCGLSKTALGAIKDLSLVHNSWTASHPMEDTAYQVIKTDCVNLQRLELDLHSDVLLEAVRYLGECFGSLKQDEFLMLDLYVWERHFSFVETSDRDYKRSLDLLEGTHQKSASTPKFTPPRDRVMRLPSTARDIILSADVNVGAIQALDIFLHSNTQIPLTKHHPSLPAAGRRACGRSDRFCYVWGDSSRQLDITG